MVEVAVLFVDYCLAIRLGPLDVALSIAGELGVLALFILEEVEGSVGSVRDEVDCIAEDEGVKVLVSLCRELGVFASGEVEDGDLALGSAPIASPVKVEAIDAVVNELLSIGGHLTRGDFFDRSCLGDSSLGINEEQLRLSSAVRLTLRSCKHNLAIGGPAETLVVGSKGQSLGLSAFEGNGEDVCRAIVGGGKGD